MLISEIIHHKTNQQRSQNSQNKSTMIHMPTRSTAELFDAFWHLSVHCFGPLACSSTLLVYSHCCHWHRFQMQTDTSSKKALETHDTLPALRQTTN